jgi:hypothetical protein
VLMSAVPRMIDGDLLRYAIGAVLGQIALFALALVAWARARRTEGATAY